MSQGYAVFEYTQLAGGFAGVRFISDTPKDQQSDKDDGFLRVIFKDISINEAGKQTSLTPEISRLTAAIEEASFRDGRIHLWRLPFEMIQAIETIKVDRSRRYLYGLSPIIPFVFVNIDELKDSPKKQLLSFINDKYKTADGQILADLDLVCSEVSKKAEDIMHRKPAS